MSLQHWIVGPQLVAVVMFSGGYIQKVYPPHDIDGPYGYRTSASKQNQQTFDEGNRYSSKLMIRTGFIALLIGLLTAPFIDRKHDIVTIILTLATAIVIPAIVILLTEKHLKQMFDKKQE